MRTPIHSFFFNDTATTEIYTLSLHDALPICAGLERGEAERLELRRQHEDVRVGEELADLFARSVTEEEHVVPRSEEHTSELQSRQYLVCRLLLEKKKS